MKHRQLWRQSIDSAVHDVLKEHRRDDKKRQSVAHQTPVTFVFVMRGRLTISSKEVPRRLRLLCQ